MNRDAMNQDAVAALLDLQIGWGVDVLLDEEPHDRFAEFQAAQSSGIPPPLETASRPAPPLARQAARTEKDMTPAAPHGAATPPAPDLSGVTTLGDLKTFVEGFATCGLQGTATHTVLAQGPVGAPLMIIGDAPDADEDRSGMPFSGETGKLLDRMLSSIGHARAELILSPAIPWRPPGGRPPSPAEVALCRPLLLRSINLHRPARLLLCGALATQIVFGPDANPLRLRGVWRMTGWGPEWGAETPALIMRHPSQLRSGAKARREIWNDLLLLAVTLDEQTGISDVIPE